LGTTRTFHVVDEAHVQHAVGFVEHKDLHGGDQRLAAAGQQAAGATRMSTPLHEAC
jgi:hypothetical protein